jgi:hypothetical protein
MSVHPTFFRVESLFKLEGGVMSVLARIASHQFRELIQLDSRDGQRSSLGLPNVGDTGR